MNKVLYIVRGIPGSGKTTLAELIAGSSDAIAADDMVGLYDDKGKYQISLQSQSHEWCHAEVEKRLKAGNSPVAVNNTFVSLNYLDNYFELAKQYGYSVAVVHTEGVFLADGSKVKSSHGVSRRISDSMRDRWQPLNPKAQLGITLEDISKNLTGLESPLAIVFDWDKTLIKTRSGENFPDDPHDLELNPQASPIVNLPETTRLFVVSNQRGIGGGQRSLDYFAERWERFNLLSPVVFDKAYFPTHKGNGNYIEFTHEFGYRERVLDRPADKPSAGLFNKIRRELQDGSYMPANAQIWVVGDGHTDDHADDYQFFLNAKNSESFYDIRYIPIEMFTVACKLIDKNS